MNTSDLRVQCGECGGISTIPAQAIGERQILNCPRCHALTSRWKVMAAQAA